MVEKISSNLFLLLANSVAAEPKVSPGYALFAMNQHNPAIFVNIYAECRPSLLGEH